MEKIITILLCLAFAVSLFGCAKKPIESVSADSISNTKAPQKTDTYDGYMLVSDLDEINYASTEILVRYGGNLYGRSKAIIDVASSIKQIGVINKVIDKKYVPKYDGETNCEELRNAGVYGDVSESLILFYNDDFILFEKIDSSSVDFKAQYVRTYGYSESEKYPNTMWIESIAELEEYKNQNKERCTSEFSDAVKKYDENFFKSNNLIMIVLKEPSGSITHEVTNLKLYYSGIDKITYSLQPFIRRNVPEVGTCDMAEWNIIIEVSKEYGKNTVKLQTPVIK